MRTLTFAVAASLDGFLAGPDGDLDWLPPDQGYGMADLDPGVDTVLMGTAAYDYLLAHGRRCYPERENFVFSRTLRPEDHPEVTFVPTDPTPFVRALKRRPGGDIWLVGGGVLFRYLLNAGLVDRVRVAVHPVLLGGGIPLLPHGGRRTVLSLRSVTPGRSGVVTLDYDVPAAPADPPG